MALVAPAGIVILGGTFATVELLPDSATRAPPLKAGPVNVTVPVAVLSPTTVAGFTLNEASAGGSTVRVATTESGPSEAERVIDLVVLTGMVVMLKLALVDPAGIATAGGTFATDESLLERVTFTSV